MQRCLIRTLAAAILFVGTHEPHVPWPDNDGYRPDELKVPPTDENTHQIFN